MKKQTFQITLKMVLSVSIVIGIGIALGVVGYFLTTKPGTVRAPITGIEFKNEEKDAAETVLKGYLEELKTKDKKELVSYFSEDAKAAAENLAGYYDNKNVRLDNFEILKVEKAGNNEFDFTVRESQRDLKYDLVGYFDNKYKLLKSEDKYLLEAIEPGKYVDTSETKDWILSRNSQKGYEIKYPENFFYQEPEITVSTMAGTSSLQGCYTRNFKGFMVKKVEIGDLSYCLAESTGAAAGSTYVDSTYTNVQGSKIVTLHFIVKYANCGNYGTEESEEYKKCESENEKGPGTTERVVYTFKMISGS